MATAVYTSYMHVLREVYDIYKSSYRIMGDNLGGGSRGPLIDKAVNEVTKPICK